jgi:hypothetical protein
MRLRRVAGSLLVFAVVATTGCHKTQPLGALPSLTHAPCDAKATWDTIVAHADLRSSASIRLAVQLPEFGGAYNDTVVKVYLTDLSARDRARQAIDRSKFNMGRGREVRFIKGTYSYRDLSGWAQCMLPFFPDGVAMFGVWEPDNRIKFAVVNDEARKHLELTISRLQLPRGAFIIEHGEYARVVQRSGNLVENPPPHSTF